MMKHFHSYGPVDSQDHFCVERQELINKGVKQLIDRLEKGDHYFTIWAPRQTGKTWLMRQIKQKILQRYPEQFTLFDFSLGGLRGMNFCP
jgi:predicted AAA+ superfamily ATPase